MLPARPQTLTRRALGTRFAGAAAAIGIGPGAAAAAGHAAAVPVAVPVPALDPDLRDAALRGLALAGHRGDPVTAAAARVSLARLADTDPEAALLGRLYVALDVRPAAWWPADVPAAAEADLAALHGAIRACLPVTFGYTDQGGNRTLRDVLPLALVHPPQGVKLLAWCRTREGFRQFFVRAMQGLAVGAGDFSRDRMALLHGLVEKETGAA